MSDDIHAIPFHRNDRYVIWKFVVPQMPGAHTIQMPKKCKILSVGAQALGYGDPSMQPLEEMVIWALCDPEAPLVPRQVYVWWTGQEVYRPPLHIPFRGTVQTRNGLVHHIFA